MGTSTSGRRVIPLDTGLVPTPPCSYEQIPNPTLDPPLAAWTPLRLCRCGHEAGAHEHFRSGEDCGVCGPRYCRSFRMRTGRHARPPGR